MSDNISTYDDERFFAYNHGIYSLLILKEDIEASLSAAYKESPPVEVKVINLNDMMRGFHLSGLEVRHIADAAIRSNRMSVELGDKWDLFSDFTERLFFAYIEKYDAYLMELDKPFKEAFMNARGVWTDGVEDYTEDDAFYGMGIQQSWFQKLRSKISYKIWGFKEWYYRKFLYAPTFVTCDKCGTSYEEFTHGQADGLCSTVSYEEKKLYGHYGSDYDLMEFDITDVSEVPGQDICDVCIDELKEKGVLKNGKHRWL